MSEYNLFAGVNGNFEFPPEVREALLRSLNIRNIGAPMTTSQRNALDTADLDEGYYIFNLDTRSFNIWRGDPLFEWHDGLESPGSVKEWAGPVVPAGWKRENGESLPRVKYKALFDVIKTTYGGLDTPTHFKLPNRGGRVTVDGNATYLLGAQGGEARVTLGITQIPAHAHSGSTSENVWTHAHAGTTPQNGGHNHTYYEPYNLPSTGSVGQSQIFRHRNLTYTGGDGTHAHDFSTDERTHTHSHTFDTDSRGGGGDHENMMPYHVSYYIIKY